MTAEPAEEELRRYQSNWLRHVTRVMPKIMLNYRPTDEDDMEDLERPWKRLLDEARTGLSRPDS